MIDSRVAPDSDRLPWLINDRDCTRAAPWQPVLLWALFAALLVAGVSYWFGMKSVLDDAAGPGEASSPYIATVTLPEPSPETAGPAQLAPDAMPQVEPVAAPAPVEIAPTPIVRHPEPSMRSKTPQRKPSPAPRSSASAGSVKAPSTPKAPPSPQAWPALQSAGADGRLARIGTFASRAQAKRGWRQIMRAYPGMTSLRAAVVPVPSLRNGRVYYRLQFGTTSHAHSEVLCQRMRMIAQSCVAVGKPRIQQGPGQ